MKILSTLLIMSVLSTQAMAGVAAQAAKRALSRGAVISAKAINKTRIPTKRELIEAMEQSPMAGTDALEFNPNNFTMHKLLGSIRTARGGAIKIRNASANGYNVNGAEKYIVFTATNQQDRHLLNAIMYEQPMGLSHMDGAYAINISELIRTRIYPGMRYEGRFASRPGHNVLPSRTYEDIAENLQTIIAKIQEAVKQESGRSIRPGRSAPTGTTIR